MLETGRTKNKSERRVGASRPGQRRKSGRGGREAPRPSPSRGPTSQGSRQTQLTGRHALLPAVEAPAAAAAIAPAPRTSLRRFRLPRPSNRSPLLGLEALGRLIVGPLMRLPGGGDEEEDMAAA